MLTKRKYRKSGKHLRKSRRTFKRKNRRKKTKGRSKRSKRIMKGGGPRVQLFEDMVKLARTR